MIFLVTLRFTLCLFEGFSVSISVFLTWSAITSLCLFVSFVMTLPASISPRCCTVYLLRRVLLLNFRVLILRMAWLGANIFTFLRRLSSNFLGWSCFLFDLSHQHPALSCSKGCYSSWTYFRSVSQLFIASFVGCVFYVLLNLVNAYADRSVCWVFISPIHWRA